jgi:MFS family permease/SepF-like predicted cell division protein (DUF552 family)
MPDPASVKAEKKEKRNLSRDLNNSIAEGAFTNSSASIVSSYSIPFALAMGASNAQIGILNSVQSLGSMLSQFPGARLTRSMTRKKLWTLSAATSRLLLVPLIFIGIFFANSLGVWLLVATIGLYSFFSSMRTPAWSSLMGDLVPPEKRGKYFGKRNMVIGTAGMVATLAAGAAVYYSGFPLIFAVAVILSIFSVFFFMKIREPDFRQERVYHYRFRIDIRNLFYNIKLHRNFAVFTGYMTLVNFAVNIAAPFIAVYMLRNLDIGYVWFAVVVTTGALAQILSMRYWGSRCDRYGCRKIMVVSGFLMCFVPLGYMLASSVPHLILLKIYDGFVWGAFDLAVFNYMLGSSPSEKRPAFVANYNLLAGLGMVLGAFLGAFLAQGMETSVFLAFYGLQAVFLISFLLRLCTVPMLRFVPEIETKETKRLPVKYVFWESVATGPARGIESSFIHAFRYPYGARVRKALGMKENGIKISRNFGSRRTPGKGLHHVFHMLDIAHHLHLARRHEALRKEGLLELEPRNRKSETILLYTLGKFSDSDRIERRMKEGKIMLAWLGDMRRDKPEVLRETVLRIKRLSEESSYSISLVEEDWLLLTPKSMKME